MFCCICFAKNAKRSCSRCRRSAHKKCGRTDDKIFICKDCSRAALDNCE